MREVGECREVPDSELLPWVDFKVDHIEIKIVLQRTEDGQKAGEQSFQPVKVFYPYGKAIEQLLAQAVQQARAELEQQQHDSSGDRP